VSAAGGLAGFRRGGGRGWGRPRGSPKVRFGGSEEALDGPVGQLGGAKALATAAAENFGEAGAKSGKARWGRLPRGPREA
jgi:hypothetical protein